VAESAVEELRQAYAAFSRGQLDESRRLCERVLLRRARDAEALHLASAIALRQGQLDVALARANEAIDSNPRDAQQFHTRGQVMRLLRRMAEAEADFTQALRLSPKLPEAHANLGLCLLERGDLPEAKAHLAIAVGERPSSAPWRYNLALCETRAGFPEAAEKHLREVLRLAPEWVEARNALGGILAQRGEQDEAAAMLESALKADPRLHPAWNNLGTVRLAQGLVSQAQECFRKCISLSPADGQAWSNLGNALRRAGDHAGAESAYREAIARSPALATAWQNLGNELREQGRLGEARSSLEQAVRLSDAPEAHLSLSLTLLVSGDIDEAWPEYAWRHGSRPDEHARDDLRSAIASGLAIELRGEQGLGDAIFFLRWAPAVHAAHLSFRGDPRLFALLDATGLLSRLVPEGSAPSAGVHCVAVGDLAYLLDEAPRYPQPLPLKAGQAAVEAAGRALRAVGPPPYVGVAWRAGTRSGAGEETLSKNVPIEALGHALSATKATIVSLQQQPREGELERLAKASGRPVFDAAAWNDDLSTMAGLIASLDEYVGVSSTNVHIAAGLDVPASLLVPQPPEWRYGHDGGSTPWFPRFRVYREHARDGWDEAFASVAADLGEKLASR
jgi:Flp pilus assembly protein TadD